MSDHIERAAEVIYANGSYIHPSRAEVIAKALKAADLLKSDEDRHLIALGKAVEKFKVSAGGGWVDLTETTATSSAVALLRAIHAEAEAKP